MTDMEAKAILAEGNNYLQAGKKVYIDIAYMAGKAPEKKKIILDQWQRGVENLYNYSLVQEIRLEEHQIALIKLVGDNRTMQLKLEEMQNRYRISEKIHEVGIDCVVEEFREIAGKVLRDNAAGSEKQQHYNNLNDKYGY